MSYTDKPLISVCVPTYNGVKYIGATLDSILQQTYRPIEIIVSDDNSKDATLSVINDKLKGTNIPFYIYNHEPSGIGANWNNSIRYAKGKYIKMLFQDDVLMPDCLIKMVKLFEADDTNTLGMVFCDRYLFGDLPAPYPALYRSMDKIKSSYSKNELLRDKYLLKKPRNKIGEPTTVIIKSEVFEKVGFFNEKLEQTLDYEYWCRVNHKFKLAFIREELVGFRVHSEQTSVFNKKRKLILDFWILPLIFLTRYLFIMHPKVVLQLVFEFFSFGFKYLFSKRDK